LKVFSFKFFLLLLGKMNHFLIFVFVSLLLIVKIHSFVYKYHNYNDITQLLQGYKTTYPQNVYLYSIGKSVRNRDLWVVAIAKVDPDIHISMRPEVKYVGNMHGNEVPSKEILISFIDYLLTNQNDPDVNYLLANTRVHILVTMNPDGFEMAQLGDCQGVTGRYNANGFDLNRNFPDLFEENDFGVQPETQAIINWLEREFFVLSANCNFNIQTNFFVIFIS
jgi:carboxypeptidase D